MANSSAEGPRSSEAPLDSMSAPPAGGPAGEDSPSAHRTVGDSIAPGGGDHASGTTFEQMFPGVELAAEAATGVVPAVEYAVGQVELLAMEFAIGWAAVTQSGAPSHVIATLDGNVIGFSRADLVRKDLELARGLFAVKGLAFVVPYYGSLSPADVERVVVRVIEAERPLPRSETLKVDRDRPTRVFVLGSPRSGTSQLGATLAECLSIPWTGEAHVGPRFAVAAEQLSGDPKSPIEFVRAMDAWNFRRLAIEAARRAYFFAHSSSSFLDKTPGLAMVRAATFMAECFPDAKFVFIRRHPIANIVSRMARFGGDFEEHCTDWAATMQEWMRVRPQLPNYLDVEQEGMASAPDHVAKQLAQFLDRPDLLGQLATSLSSGALEKTGAGDNWMSLSKTDWTPEQKARFTAICDVTMRAFGYYVDFGS